MILCNLKFNTGRKNSKGKNFIIYLVVGVVLISEISPLIILFRLETTSYSLTILTLKGSIIRSLWAKSDSDYTRLRVFFKAFIKMSGDKHISSPFAKPDNLFFHESFYLRSIFWVYSSYQIRISL